MGYIEKDWGCSFPKTYIWCQGNNFEKSNASFMLSIANVPFKMFNFRGMICVLLIDDKEYKTPVRGKMEKDIFESIDSVIAVTLRHGDNIVFRDTSKNCGLEIVK